MPEESRGKAERYGHMELEAHRDAGELSPSLAGVQVHSRKRVMVHTTIIALLTFALYFSSFGNGYIWDDDDYVYANRVIQGNSTIIDIWLSHQTPQYYPVTFSSFWLEHKIWGLNPAGYHVVNCLLHILNAIWVYFLMRRLCEPLAFAVALIFAVHPIQVETVAWISERKNVLAVFFFLSAVHFTLDYLAQWRLRSYLLSFLMFVLSLLSKSVTVCFVCLPFLIKWWQRKQITRWDVYRIIPFCAAGLAAGLHTVWLEVHKVGAQGSEWDLSVLERCLLPGKIVLFYMYKIVLPYDYMFNYPRWELDPTSTVQWVPTLLLIAMLGLLVQYRGQLGRGAAATFGFFVISLFPALGIFKVYPMRYSFVADHFAYLSTIPMICFMVGTCAFAFRKLCGRHVSPATSRKIALLTLVFTASVMSLAVVDHARHFRDAETLWRHVIQRNPQSLLAYNNLGLILAERGEVDGAVAVFAEGLAVDPADVEIRNNIGIIMAQRKRLDEAMKHFGAALAAHPNHVDTYNNIATVYAMQGRQDLAVKFYEMTLKSYPDHVVALQNLGRIYRDRGELETAVRYFERALDADATNIVTHLELGAAYADLNLTDLAIEQFTRAAQLEPADARPHNNLALIYLQQKKLNAAVAGFQQALRRDPQLGDAHYHLGYIYWSTKRLSEAYNHFTKAKAGGKRLAPEVEKFLQTYRRQRDGR